MPHDVFPQDPILTAAIIILPLLQGAPAEPCGRLPHIVKRV